MYLLNKACVLYYCKKKKKIKTRSENFYFMLVTSSRAIAEFAAVKSRNRNFVYITKLMHDTKTNDIGFEMHWKLRNGKHADLLLCNYIFR